MTVQAEPGPGERRRLARAFGLDIDLSFEAPGLPDAHGPPGARATRADLVPPEAIDADWPAEGVERMLEERFGAGEPERAIDAHPTAGYRLYAQHFGLARLSPSGDRILCSPPDVEPWSWQRFLVGRILPWAAVLRGLEAFHASAVALDGRAIAFVGPTGAGKTSLAVQLVARGARFLTDDVLSVEHDSGRLTAHSGAGIASIRPAERDGIPDAAWRELGEVLGHSGKTYVTLAREAAAVPLAAVYFLRATGGAPIERLDPPDPRLLLASTFVLGVRTSERLRNQLDVCSRLAHDIPLFWLEIETGTGSRRLAERVEAHVRETLGAAA